MRNLNPLLYLTLLLFLFNSCRSDDFGAGGGAAITPVSFQVETRYDASLGDKMAPGVVVTLESTTSTEVYTATTGPSGQAAFNQILPGTYLLSAAGKLSKAEFEAAFGYSPPTTEVSFNGVKENIVVNANTTSAELVLKSARLGDLVIKQIYYAGSHITQGASLRDQFIEIYNNSNEVIFADGLYIAQTYGKNNTTTSSFTLSSGQFDWSKSLEMTVGSKANTDYVYSDYVLQVPGNGSQYPLAPGESLVIAQTGVKHKAPLTDNSGEPVTVVNPELTVDLSTADFEVYLGTFRESIGEAIYKYDIQNPAVPDMAIGYWGIPGYYSNNRDFIMDTLGRDSFVIFRTDGFTSFGAYTDPSVTTVGSSSNFFKQIPTSLIIDGVELQHYNPNSQRPKHLNASIDAGQISTDAAYISQSVIRKTAATLASGRRVLSDTNNSREDFVKLNKAAPRAFAP